MPSGAIGAGLSPRFSSPSSTDGKVELHITEEAGLTAPPDQELRIVPLVEEGAIVQQGMPVAHLRDEAGVCLVAPMPGRVAHLRLRSGRRLSDIVFFREAGGDRRKYGSGGELRRLMQEAGLWPWLRRRPFGSMPKAAEVPAAIVVMAADTRPLAPDPLDALRGREDAFGRGLSALAGLADCPIFVVRAAGADVLPVDLARGRVRPVTCGTRHPQGLAGIRIHRDCPAGIDAPVWDIHAEDVAGLGEFLESGLVPETRLVHVAGPGLRESRLLRTQPGADLRGLTRRLSLPGAHRLLTGSPLDGRPAHWLGQRDRQVSVMPRPAPPDRMHWLKAVLSRSAQPAPVIPTAALTQALGAALPAAALVRALTSGDDETAMDLGVLSLLEEDLALADYVLGGAAHLQDLLRNMLNRIEAELAV